jgi:hypothetical protein
MFTRGVKEQNYFYSLVCYSVSGKMIFIFILLNKIKYERSDVKDHYKCKLPELSTFMTSSERT